jgi:hypothetical protein
MSNQRTRRIFVAAICALQLVAIALYVRNRADADEAAALQRQATEEQRRQAVTGGVPAHRQRIDDFIAQTGTYPDIDALAAGLNDRVQTDFDIVGAAGIQTADPSPQMQFAVVLADRRVARLYVMLQDLGPAEASRRAAALVDAKLEVHDAGMTKGVGQLRETGVSEPIPVELNFRALSAAMFLCAALCDPQTLLHKVDQWNEKLGRHVDDVHSDPAFEVLQPEPLQALQTYVTRYGRPEGLYLLNIYMFVLERHVGLTPQETMERVEMEIPGPELFHERLPFCAWDAHTNPFDFTHFHRGVPVDTENVLFEVSFARSWRYLRMDEAGQEELLRQVRGLVEELAGEHRETD